MYYIKICYVIISHAIRYRVNVSHFMAVSDMSRRLSRESFDFLLKKGVSGMKCNNGLECGCESDQCRRNREELKILSFDFISRALWFLVLKQPKSILLLVMLPGH